MEREITIDDAVSPAALPGPSSAEEVRGVRAGAVTFVGIAAANLANYAFNFLGARALGPRAYSDLASLTAVTGLIGLPLAAIQFVVARDVARLVVDAGLRGVAGYVSRAISTIAAIGLAATLLFLALAPAMRSALNIQSTFAVALTALTTLALFLSPVLIGAAQGLQRFSLLAAAVAVGPVLRVPLLAAALASGTGVTGAVAATLVSSFIGVGIAAGFLGGNVFTPRLRLSLPSWRRTRDVAPVLIGVLAITGLSTDDVIVGKIVFSSHTSGIYSSASLVGRVLLYLPGAVVTVLLPKVASRAALDKHTEDILEASLIVTAAFCVAGCIAYTLLGRLIVRVALGSSYAEGSSLLWRFGIAMTIYALLNVILTYTLGHRRTASAWILGCGVVGQTIAYTLFHRSPTELVTVNVLTAVVLLLLHEVFVQPFLRDGVRRLVLLRRPL